MMKKAFTLAEVMITLVVIGIITAIVMPIMVNSAPKKNYMKFKKAHTTFGKVIRELVNSDQYYKDGNLGKMPNGDDVSSAKYFCQTIADVLSTKKVNCSDNFTDYWGGITIVDDSSDAVMYVGIKQRMDYICKLNTTTANVGEEIVTSDGIVFYQTNPGQHFGSNALESGQKLFHMIDPGSGEPIKNDFLKIYKLFCLDIDGIPAGGSEHCDDKTDVCPFGYALRVDGAILQCERADQWLAKDFNGKDPSEQE